MNKNIALEKYGSIIGNPTKEQLIMLGRHHAFLLLDIGEEQPVRWLRDYPTNLRALADCGFPEALQEYERVTGEKY